jgi:hypothetical protein
MLVYRQMQQIEREEKQLKESFQTALRDRIDELATTGQNGRPTDRVVKIRTSVPVTTDVLREMVSQSAEAKPASSEQGVALKESSEFEVKGGDM